MGRQEEDYSLLCASFQVTSRMKQIYLLLLISLPLASTAFAQNNCANATQIPLNGTNVCQTTNGANLQVGENVSPITSGGGCNATQSMWLYFYTGSNTAVELTFDVTNNPNCSPAWNVYGPFATPTGNCLPGAGSLVYSDNILSAAAGQMNVTGLTNLQENSYYLVQVLGRAGGGPGDGFSSYCITAEPAPCQCSDPCGPACGFTSTPTVAQVTGGSCPFYDFNPDLQTGESQTQCYTIQAINTTITFGMIASTSGCAGGTVTGITWQVYNTGSCSSPVLSGTAIGPTWTGMTIGGLYTVCYTPTSACTRLGQWPYFVGAIPPVLPVEWLHIGAVPTNRTVEVGWAVLDLGGTSHYIIERSADATRWEEVGNLSANDNIPADSDKWNRFREQSGNTGVEIQLESLVALSGAADKADENGAPSASIRQYMFTDQAPRFGQNYYRVRQVDADGAESVSQVVEAYFNTQGAQPSVAVYPQPAQTFLNLEVATPSPEALHLALVDATGRLVASWNVQDPTLQNAHRLDVAHVPAGVYHLQVRQGSWCSTQRVILQ